MTRLVAVDAFCGAGGMSLGLAASGYQIALGFDYDEVAVDTYVKNIGSHAKLIDVNQVSPPEIIERADVAPNGIDVVVGGPPCQGFSLQRRGPRSDGRNELVLAFLELVRYVKPRAFLMENVPAITSVRGRDLLQTVQDSTAALGFSTYLRVLNAVDYGVPQVRKRAFLVGIRGGGAFEWPAPTVETPRTVRQAIGDLPTPPADGSPHPSVPNHFREANLSELNIRRIRHVPEGGGRLDLPPELQLECHKNGHRHLDTYGRLSWDKPSGTITARFDSFTRGRFGHPVDDRSITLREGARLQGFPDEFVFLGNREQGARMIGNAVPPPLAESLGNSITAALEQ